MKKLYLVLKENKKIVKKIRGFLDSEFLKTCHERVNFMKYPYDKRMKIEERSHENVSK